MVLAVEHRDLLEPSKRTATRLTDREQHVLALAATGWTIAALADALNLTPEAVGVLIASIVAKVGARSKIEAVLIAVRTGLIDLPSQPDPAGRRTPDYRASAVRPVLRLLRWSEADVDRRIIKLCRTETTDVDGAAT
jgi:DNA-binding CsgD family transcriptional regulator